MTEENKTELQKKSEECMAEVKEVLKKYDATLVFIKQEHYNSVESKAQWDWGVEIVKKAEEAPKE